MELVRGFMNSSAVRFILSHRKICPAAHSLQQPPLSWTQKALIQSEFRQFKGRSNLSRLHVLQNPTPAFTKFVESVCDFGEYYVSSSLIASVSSISIFWLMGPIRGLRKKKKFERKLDANGGTASDSSERDDAVDWWDHFSRRTNGLPSALKGLDRFKSIFKVSRKTFDYICLLVKDDMTAKSSNFTFLNGRPLSLYDQVAVALRRLGSGESLVTIGDSFGVNHSTVSQVTWRFVESMEERGLRHLHWPSTEVEMAQMKSNFEKIQGLPNCCGSIDTTHITMCLPASDPTSNVWLDQEKNHSMVLQVIVDAEMRFRDILTGFPGKMSDWLVFQSSTFHKLCEKGERLNGKRLELIDSSEIREYIVGDSGYPLLPYLVTPYDGKELQPSKAEFNKRHTETRVVVQRALASLKERWRIIHGVMWRPDKHRLPRIILVCCLLHNIAIDIGDEKEDGDVPLSIEHDADCKQQLCDVYDSKGAYLRDKLSLLFI